MALTHTILCGVGAFFQKGVEKRRTRIGNEAERVSFLKTYKRLYVTLFLTYALPIPYLAGTSHSDCFHIVNCIVKWRRWLLIYFRGIHASQEALLYLIFRAFVEVYWSLMYVVTYLSFFDCVIDPLHLTFPLRFTNSAYSWKERLGINCWEKVLKKEP